MKVTKVLLRWYKSFNVNYMGYDDRRDDVLIRPWNIHKDNESDKEIDYPFVEIPIEKDITTIVGANESGKSHLLSAINKVIFGKDINNKGNFSKTDRCHYASQKSQNTDLWPYIGLQFIPDKQEFELIISVLGTKESQEKFLNDLSITLILGPKNDKLVADLYINENKYELSEDKLQKIRKILPTVEFIHSDIPIASSISISNLIRAYKQQSESNEVKIFKYDIAQILADAISRIEIPRDPAGDNSTFFSKINELKSKANTGQELKEEKIHLELLLFRDILDVSIETLEYIEKLGESDRSYIESIVISWNQKIEKELNLSRYWQQDEKFSLEINYKNGIIYFEITDKTGYIYTFKERSSGLKYFLSYYIQAKSIGNLSNESVIILMDEPDSFLSILGQKNLLSIFEDLTSYNLSRLNRQLLYTTHSPFLINRNYPRRIRLVRKGDAEEGTQYIPNTQVRRYEPIRTALGVDCAQTIFMGATNVVLEGPTDQLIISEMIRFFIEPDNASDFLDLNLIVLTSSSNGAPGVEKLVAASLWGDELNPTIVVLLDSDDEGDKYYKRLVGEEKKVKKLLDKEFVLQIKDLVEVYEENHEVVTTEDILSISLYKKSVESYLKKWYVDLSTDTWKKINDAFSQKEYAIEGVIVGTKKIFETIVFKNEKRTYDKFGVLQEAISIINNDISSNEKNELKKRLIRMCNIIRERIDLAESSIDKQSGKLTITRIIQDFQKKYRQSVNIFDLIQLIKRLEREVDSLGIDGEILRLKLKEINDQAEVMRNSSQQLLTGEKWEKWSAIFEAIRKNPINPDLP